MSDFAGLDALAARQRGGTPSAPTEVSSGHGSSGFSGLEALAAKKSGGAPAPPATNPFAAIANSPIARGAGSALGTISNAIDLPWALTQAAAADVFDPNQRAGGDRRWRQVQSDLAAGGGWKNIPGALANVAENDVYFRKGSLQRVMADPSANGAQRAAADFLLHHPWVAGGADFATEFLNPGNILTGEVAGRGAQIASRVIKDAPIIGPAVERASQAMAATFDRYNPLARAGGDEARMTGRLAASAAAEAKKHNAQIAAEIFGNPGKLGLGGTTREEQFEILRRATGGAPKPPLNSSGLSDAELQARADRYRKIIEESDQIQRDRGMLHQEHENYFNMRGAYELPETARDIALGGAPQSGASGALRYRPPTRQEKVFHTFDEVLDAVAQGKVKLKDDFSPYGQLVSHLNRVSGNVALDDFIGQLAKTDAAREIVYQRPNAAPGKQAVFTGEMGLVAAKADAMKSARRLAAKRATDEIARQFGIQPWEVQQITARQFADAGNLGARLSELQRAGKALPGLKQGVQNELLPTAGRVGESVKTLANRETGQVGRAGAVGETVAPSVNRRIEQIHGNAAMNAQRVRGAMDRVTARVGRLQMDTLKRGTLLYAKMMDPERPIAAAYRDLRDKMATEMMSEGDPNSHWSKMRAKLTPDGYLRVKDVPGLSSLERFKYTDVKREVLSYLTDHGAPQKEAEGLGAFIDRFNSLFRIGILTNPLIHPGYNLLWSYLGGGGDAKRLANVFRDSPLDAEAARYGAHAPLSSFSASGNQNRLVQSVGDAARGGKGVLGKAAAVGDWTATRAAELNRKIVFDTMERRMATEMWASLTAKGVDKAKAGELVRKAFGDYDNLTATERKISRAFFFYPWTKAVIPFWLKTLATDPKWVSAPSQAILTHNEIAGDPNVGKESPFTLYTGNDQAGQPQYQALPMPQKRLEAPLEAATGNVGRAINEAQYHLTPALGMAARGLEQHFQSPQEPGVTPADVMYDRDAPTATMLAQIAKYAVENGVPFEGLIRGAVHGAGETAGGAPGRALENLAGGFQYGQANPSQQKALNRLFGGFQRRYNVARNIPDPAARSRYQAMLYETFRREADVILKTNP